MNSLAMSSTAASSTTSVHETRCPNCQQGFRTVLAFSKHMAKCADRQSSRELEPPAFARSKLQA